jgi:hypothetical protein
MNRIVELSLRARGVLLDLINRYGYAARSSSPRQSTTKPQRGLDRLNESSRPLFFFNKPI